MYRACVLWVVVSYNLLVRARNMLKEAWSGIDVQLKRRHDLIPNLVESVKAYSSHERDLFENLAQTRTAGLTSNAIPPGRRRERTIRSAQVPAGHSRGLSELKASANFLALQKTLTEIEDDLQYARRYYNAVVRDYNIRIQSFPGLLIAGLFGFEKSDYFEIEYATERQAPMRSSCRHESPLAIFAVSWPKGFSSDDPRHVNQASDRRQHLAADLPGRLGDRDWFLPMLPEAHANGCFEKSGRAAMDASGRVFACRAALHQQNGLR